MVSFRWHCLPFSSPGRAAGKGRRFFSPPLQHLSLPPPPICLKTPHNAHLIMAYHHDERGRGDKPWGQLPRGHPTTLLVWRDWTGEGWLSPPFPLINTSSPGDEKANKKKWKNKRKTKDEKARKKKGEENRGWKEERNKNEEEDECRRTRKKTKHIREEKEEKKKTHREEEEEPPASEAPAPPSTPSWALPLGQLPPSPPLLLLLL